MKTVVKILSFVALSAVSLQASPVLAQLMPAPVKSSGAASSASPSTSSTASTAGGPAGIVLPATTGGLDAGSLASEDKHGSSANSAVPESVKNFMKSFSNNSNVTLDDLNAARETVAKLDVMIEIEKKLGDLAEIRQERNKLSAPSSSLNTMSMQASALLPKNVAASPMPAGSAALATSSSGVSSPSLLPTISKSSIDMSAESTSKTTKSVPKEAGKVVVERIYGADNRYTAVIKVEGAPVQTVHEGDKLSDSSIVRSISAKGVVFSLGGKLRTVRVKNLETIFVKS